MTDMTTVLRNTCPHCGYLSNRVTGLSGTPSPGEGSISLCLGCGEWSVFGTDLSLRKPTDDEFIEINDAPDARGARRAWMKLNKERSRDL